MTPQVILGQIPPCVQDSKKIWNISFFGVLLSTKEHNSNFVVLLFFYRGLSDQVFGQHVQISDLESCRQKWLGIAQVQCVSVRAILNVPFFALLVKFH